MKLNSTKDLKQMQFNFLCTDENKIDNFIPLAIVIIAKILKHRKLICNKVFYAVSSLSPFLNFICILFDLPNFLAHG